jgi:hypothetical protein
MSHLLIKISARRIFQMKKEYQIIDDKSINNEKGKAARLLWRKAALFHLTIILPFLTSIPSFRGCASR